MIVKLKKLIKRYFKRIVKKLNRRKKPIGNVYYDSKAEGYEEKRKKKEWWHREQNEMNRIISNFPNGMKVLDVPFGTGRFVPYLLEKEMEIYGLEISQDMIEEAAKILGDDLKKCTINIGDATQMPYDDNYFDMVICFRFLQNIISYDQAKIVLKEISRVTKKYAIIEMPIRKPDKPRSVFPKGSDMIGGNFYEEDVVQFFHNENLEIVDRSEAIKDSGNSNMFIFTCQKM